MGIVFKRHKDGSAYEVLRKLTPSDGFFPSALVEGREGTLYGTASGGGLTNGMVSNPRSGMGVVFKLQKDGGGYRVLQVIVGSGFDADEGYFDSNTFGLLQGKYGTLFGTLKNNDDEGAALVFRLKKDGREFTKLHSLAYTGGGSGILELIQGNDGALYGTVRGDICKVFTAVSQIRSTGCT